MITIIERVEAMRVSVMEARNLLNMADEIKSSTAALGLAGKLISNQIDTLEVAVAKAEAAMRSSH